MPCQVDCGVPSKFDWADLDSGTLGTLDPTAHTWILRMRHVCNEGSEPLCSLGFGGRREVVTGTRMILVPVLMSGQSQTKYLLLRVWVCDGDATGASRLLGDPELLDAEFRASWMP